MEIMPDPPRRFVSGTQLIGLLECFRRTAVGYTDFRPTKYERMLRAVEMFEAREGKTPGAYKDLEAALSSYTPIR